MKKKLSIISIISIITLMLFNQACQKKISSSAASKNPTEVSQASAVITVSPIHYTHAMVLLGKTDGCGYILKLDDGSVLEPRGLKEEYKKDSLEVLITYENMKGLRSICMMGPIVNITDLKLFYK